MTALLAKFLRDVTAPLGGALFRAIIALALVIIALGALSSALIVANIWLYAWLATIVTPLQSLGIVSGAWLTVALIATIAAYVVLARSRTALIETPRPSVRATTAQMAAVAQTAEAPRLATLADQVDAMVDPLAKTLSAMGFQNETAALVAGSEAFKKLKTTQLSALALIVGYAAARAFAAKD